MIYNMISSKSIIAKVIADLDLKERDIKISDIKEWIGEAMEKIGSVQQLDHRVAVIPVTNYQAKLPCDLYRLNQVAFSFKDNCGWVPMLRTTNSFSVYTRVKHQCDEQRDSCEDILVQDNTLIPVVKNLFNYIDDKQALDQINSNPNIKSTLSTLINEYTFGNCTDYNNQLAYDVKPGYLYTSVPEGYVKISYHAIHTDNDGMPMIPDLSSYSEAIYWYVVLKLSYPRYYRGDMSQHVYYDMKNSWNYYRKQAYAESIMPDQSNIQSISNTWHKLYPEVLDDDIFYDTTGRRQVIYNQN